MPIIGAAPAASILPVKHYPDAGDRVAAGMVEHWCEHPGCASWGGWGFARGRGKPVWFCYEHREDGERFL
jgi:hypothetical protein